MAAIALGSNLPSRSGSPTDTLHAALERLQALGLVKAVSAFYSTAPVGYLDQPHFTNAAALLETSLAPSTLLQRLLGIEREMGRDRTAAAVPKGPRTLDLDLLLVGGIILNTPELTLPHPEMLSRRFVLEPLAEIAPGMVHPVTGRTIKDHLHQLP